VARLSSSKRSHVERVWQWPPNVRKTGFGILHDRLWFPAEEPDEGFVHTEEPRGKWFDGGYYRLYMDRKMVWFKWGIRLHTFYQGDDDAAVHDHPWWFITIPFKSYIETVERVTTDRHGKKHWTKNSRKVRAFLPQFRSARHRHFVHGEGMPVKTLILTGSVRRNWGFWPTWKRFVPHREWTNYAAGDTTRAPREET